MLRVSMEHAGVDLDLGTIVGPGQHGGPPGAQQIIAFTRALVDRTEDLGSTRSALVAALGETSAAAVAASVGNFEMMNRILDATGVPTPGTMADIASSLRS